MNNLTVGILSWKAPTTLVRTLQSYKDSGLLNYPNQIFIFFQEVSGRDKEIARRFGLKYYSSEINLGIAGGYREMLKYVKTDNYLFLEDDWFIREDKYSQVIPILQDAERLLHTADVIRLRNRRKPGDPLWTYQFKRHELEHPECLLDCVHWREDPQVISPLITNTEGKWYLASSQNAGWTNNPHMVRTSWVEKYLLPRLGHHDIETDICKWWPTSNFKVMQGEGLFTHNRAFNVRGIEINLHEDEAVSNHIRRHKDFFEETVLDYVRDHYQTQKTIVDVGANIGNHTLYFANFLKYQNIVCFEPIRENFKLLETNTAYPNIKLHQLALSNQKGTVKMELNTRNMGACKVSPTGFPVQATTLDSFNFQNLTLLKIDVERHEPQMLEGARETIKRCHPLILIEDDKHTYEKLLPGYQVEMYWDRYKTYLYS